ncbi:MAG: hypothetical protein ACD_60C00134G0001 [uncultured bacterium]|nr:MAG: hypothetical protein ACD_60C00134G0001 [uncultured bacterium]
MIKQYRFLFLIGACAAALLTGSIKAAQSLDHIVATVNENVITQSELNQAVNTARKQMASTDTSLPPANTLRHEVLNRLIDRKLQLQLAEQAGIHKNDADVDKTINTIAENNHISSTELYQKIAEEGMSRGKYRKEIRDELIIQQLQQQEIGSKITMTPADVKAFMRIAPPKNISSIKEYHVDDILIPLPDSPTPDEMTVSKKLSESIATKLRAGENYQEIAAANKNITDSDLGWRKLDELPTAFADVIARMKPNEIRGPLRAANGFHLLRLLDVHNTENAEKITPPTESEAQQLAYQHKFEEALKTWLAKMRSQAIINMHPENE